MMGIEHARNPIKPKSVKVVIVHPESQIAEQKPEDLVAPIIEQPAVP
jgi:hypothetical protein